MGFRFYQSFPLGKLLRLNVSKSGLSLGIGPPGFNINLGRRGVRRTVGLPGSGLSYQDSRSWRSLGQPSPTEPPTAPAPGQPPAATAGGGVLLLLLLGAALGAWWLMKPSPTPAPMPTPVASSAALPPTPPTPPPQPPEVRALARPELHELQHRLNQLGHRAGPPDGLDGPRTRAAVRRFLRPQELPAGAALDTALLRRVRAAAQARVGG